MPSHSSKPALLLGLVAATMALLVGLVGSSRRLAGPSREPALLEPWTSDGPQGATLSAPRPIAADDPAPSATTPKTAPKTAPRPAPAGAPEVQNGLVLRPDGEPAAGARVKLGAQLVRTSAEGRFQLACVASEGEDLVACLEGFEPAVLPRFRPAGPGDVRLFLGPETLALTGTLVDRSGQPLKGWTVELDGPDALRDHGLREPVRTDLEGRFVLSDVPAGVHVVRAWHKRREHATLSSPATAGEPGLTIVASDG